MRIAQALLPLVLALAAVACPGATAAPTPADPATPPVCAAEEGYAAAFGGRRTFLLKPDELVPLKAALHRDAALEAAYRSLIALADAALARQPGSVMDKTMLPPSGDRHDYLSIAPYWWPDPASPSAPYVRRDGEINPARNTARYDRTAMGRMSADVRTLSLAYFYSDDARYADKAAALIRIWFLDPSTAMNPNANYAQAVQGREDGRAEGVLDTAAFQPVIDAVGLIAPAGAFKTGEVAALQRWFGRYVDWMKTSRNGRAEQAAKNNHGMWFDAQIVQYALFARRPQIARAVVDGFAARRIDFEITAEGRLPAELTRTRSLHYSIYALTAAYDVADLARCLGVDLWDYSGPRGQGLRNATNFLAAYRGRLDRWPYKEIRPDPVELDDLLTRAAWAWGPGSYPRVVHGLPEALEYRADAKTPPR